MVRARAAVTVAILLTTPGCLLQTTTTHVEVVDPGEVTLDSGRGKLGAGHEPSEVVLDDGAFETEPGASSRYRVRAVREAGGAIAFEWDTRVPLLNGEHQLVLGSAGTIDGPLKGIVTADTVRRDTLKLSSCAALWQAHRKRTLVGYRATEWEGCGGSANVPFSLETPWSNVSSVVQRVEPMRDLAAVVMVGSTILFGGLGALFLALPPCRDGSNNCNPGPKNAIGWSFIGAAGVIDLGWLPTLIAPSHETVSYPSPP